MRWIRCCALGLVAWCALGACGLAGQAPPRLQIVNRQNPGQKVTLKPHLVSGAYTVVEFYSDYCPPCRQVAPLMGRLAFEREGIYVRRVNINRVEARSIDWDSPVAQQYDIHRVPYFLVYDHQQKLILKGDEARDQVILWMREADIVR